MSFSGAESASISINVIIPRVGIRGCCVSSSMTIASLASHCSRRDYHFIFNGELLDGSRTLDFYSITNHDAIVAVPANGPRATADHWMRATRDSDAFMETIQFATNRTSRADFLRLKDLRANRLECRPRAFRKMMANSAQATAPDVNQFATVVDGPPSELPCGPLPVCW
jgi:hypothetical protein